MALALGVSAPWFTYRRHHRTQPGSILSLWSCRVNFRSSRRCGIRCDAGEPPAPKDTPDAVSASHPPSWVHVEPAKDAYAGWAPLERDQDADRRAGFLKVGAGVALAFAFSLVTYAAYSRSGSKHAVVYSVTTLQRDKELPSGSEDSGDAHSPLDSETSGTPSSIESKQDFRGEDPQPDVASPSGLQQKETAPGQDSFPSEDVEKYSEDVEKYSDEVNALSTASFRDSDVESSDELVHSDVEKVNSEATSPSEELEQPINDDGLNPISDVKENDELPTDDKSNVVDSSGSPISAWDLAEPSADESDVHESPSQPSSDINVLENEKEQSGEISLGYSGSVASVRGPEESNDAEAKKDAGPSAESKEETFTVSASLVVPKGAAEDVLELLGLDTESAVGELDSSNALEPGQMKSLSVVETLSPSPGSEFWQMESVEYFGIPAPSAPSSAAAHARPWSVVVPAAVDHEHEQALEALQTLKVIEPDVEAGGICTRREYARWLIAVTGTLTRSPARKVLPAMFIENVSELAFNDVVPEDPDFPYIQGLAESGLISSNLSRHDSDENGRSTDGCVFLPDSSLCRQDLVSWKVALEGNTVQTVDKQKLKAQTGFIDFDRINEDALPFLAKDFAAGESSIMSSAFGFTRRFQPGKPVTRGQAAIALVTGEAADVVAEELTRVEAEDIADAAVVAELALEGRARKYLDEYFETELKLERDARLAVEKQLEQVKTELDSVIKDRDDQRVSLESLQAAVQAERDLLHRYRLELDEQLQALTRYQVEVGIEKDRLETLRKEAAEDGQALTEKKAQVEVEKQALILARLWAEDEARKARSHAKVLEQARKRWEGQGIEVRVVDKDLDGENIPALGWQNGGRKTRLSKFLQRPPVQDILEKAGDLKARVVERFFQLLEAIRRALNSIRLKVLDSFHVAREKGTKSLQVAGEKAQVIQQDTFSAVSRKAQEVKDATTSTVAGASSSTFSAVSKKAQEVKDATASTVAGASSTVSRKAQEMKDATASTVAGASTTVSRKAQEVKDATTSTVAGASANVSEGTRKIADGFRGEAQKIVGKFKS